MMAVGLNECRANMLTTAAGHERHAPLASAQTASLVPPEVAWSTIQWATASNLGFTSDEALPAKGLPQFSYTH
eukprot:COSAG06_NODE_39972_length_406_cov_19.133550_1_plen_73_part_00